MRASRTNRRSVVVLKELKRKSTAAMGGGDRTSIRIITKICSCRCIFFRKFADGVRVSQDKDYNP